MTKSELNAIAKTSIHHFLVRHQSLLQGRVLDYGCGIPPHAVQPYRHLVQGEYVPFDQRGYTQPGGHFDCVLMTQVMQYLESPEEVLSRLAARTKLLVMTFPVHWPEVEGTDLKRYTQAGMRRLLRSAGFEGTIEHHVLWTFPFEDFNLIGDYGVIAWTNSSSDHT